jgi:hypothetical protein
LMRMGRTAVRPYQNPPFSSVKFGPFLIVVLLIIRDTTDWST